MTEERYEDHDAHTSQLSQKPLSARRETFIPLAPPPPAWSAEDAELQRTRTHEFDAVDTTDPDGPHAYNLLRAGHKLQIPGAVLDAQGRVMTDTVLMTEYQVGRMESSDDGLMVQLENTDGIEVASIPAAMLNEEGARFEAVIARRLLERSGVDIHSPDIHIVESLEDGQKSAP